PEFMSLTAGAEELVLIEVPLMSQTATKPLPTVVLRQMRSPSPSPSRSPRVAATTFRDAEGVLPGPPSTELIKVGVLMCDPRAEPITVKERLHDALTPTEPPSKRVKPELMLSMYPPQVFVGVKLPTSITTPAGMKS